jgi:hypothetical protein
MCQGPEVTLSEEEYMEEYDLADKVERLEDALEIFDTHLNSFQDNELSELIYFMNELNMWDEETLSYETVVKAYQVVKFIQASKNIPHEFKI